jgi:VanZ family protein
MAHVSVPHLIRVSLLVRLRSLRSRLTLRRLSLWLPVVMYAAAIFFVSSMPHPPMPGGISDKSGHGATYCGLALVVLRALAGAEWAGVTAGTSLAAAALTTAFGGSDELHQLFVPGRSADVHDLVADATGAAAGVIAAWLAAALIRRRKSRIYG